MPYLAQGDFLLPCVLHLHAPAAIGKFVVCKACTADAQVIISLLLDFPEIVLRGDTGIKAYERPAVRGRRGTGLL